MFGGIIDSALKAIAAACAVWSQERAMYNRPDMIKNQLDITHQRARDAANAAAAVLSNPNSTPADHADALRAYRLMDS